MQTEFRKQLAWIGHDRDVIAQTDGLEKERVLRQDLIASLFSFCTICSENGGMITCAKSLVVLAV